MKTLTLLILVCVMTACTENQKRTPILTQMSVQDSLFFKRMIESNQNASSQIAQAKKITELFALGDVASFQSIADTIGYNGPVEKESLINDMQRSRKFLCSYQGGVLIASPILDLVQYAGMIPACFIACPIIKESGQNQMQSRGMIMINVYQIMSTYQLIIKNCGSKYHVSPERWLCAIVAQELYHARTPGGGNELESDMTSMRYAGYTYLIMRLMDISHYHYDGVYEASMPLLTVGYREAYTLYYSCSKSFVPQFGSEEDYRQIVNSYQCYGNAIEYDLCIMQNTQRISVGLLQKMQKTDPLIVEKVYSCIMQSK